MMSGNLASIDHSAFVTLVALGMLLGARGQIASKFFQVSIGARKHDDP